MADEWLLSKLEGKDGGLWIVRKNMHPVPANKNRNEYRYCTYLTVHYKPGTDEGFPSSADLDALEDIEDRISEICDGNHSVFVASVFMPKIKDYIIYTKSPDKLGNILESFAKLHGQFNFEFGGRDDPSWEQYDSFAEPE